MIGQAQDLPLHVVVQWIDGMHTGYDPEKQHRRSIRLKGYDYSQNGAYFITICTQNKRPYFEQYPKLRQIVARHWQKIPSCFTNVTLDEFVIMPNHIHGIIIVGATLAVAQNDGTGEIARNDRAGARPAPTIGEIVGTFKSVCVHDWLGYIKENKIDVVGKFWQRNYYEHIIRNEENLNLIREYIINNPLQWQFDRENPKRIEGKAYTNQWGHFEEEIYSPRGRGQSA